MDKEELLGSAADRVKNGTEESRYQVVKDLSQLNSPRAIPFLMEAVGDESYRVREEALQGICSFPSEVVFPWLGAFLRNHDNANLRNAAIEAFPRYGTEATISRKTTRRFIIPRPPVYELEPKLKKIDLPAIILTGDEDAPCLEPSIFMKRNMANSGLVVFPNK